MNRAGRLHHDVDEERAAGEPHLRALPLELVDRLLDLGRAVLARTPPRPLQHPVDRGLAEAACWAISRIRNG